MLFSFRSFLHNFILDNSNHVLSAWKQLKSETLNLFQNNCVFFVFFVILFCFLSSPVHWFELIKLCSLISFSKYQHISCNALKGALSDVWTTGARSLRCRDSRQPRNLAWEVNSLFSVSIVIIPTCLLCQMQAIFSGAEFLSTISKFIQRRKILSLLVYVFHKTWN